MASAARVAGPAALCVLLVYVVVLGGTPPALVDPDIGVLNALAGAALIAVYVWKLREGDRLDGAVGIALALFAVAAACSPFPRQSFDGAIAGLVYAAAFFVARRVMRVERARKLFSATAMGLSVAVASVAVVRWIPPIVSWLKLSGGVVPPLGLNLDGWLWGHRYDVALLMALLYPAWWTGRPSAARRSAAVVVGAASAGLILLAGSRTVWLACVAATIALALPVIRRPFQRLRRYLMWAVGFAAIVVLLTAVTGLAGAVAARVLSIGTLSSRVGMWGDLTQLWLRHPVAGLGPGSFPWDLQQTAYFATNTFAPRHPDSVVFQLLPELGLMGILALAALVAGLLPRLLQVKERTALWAIAVFLVASIGTNPTDFAFLVAVLIAWTAYALPSRSSAAPVQCRSGLLRLGMVRTGIIASLVVITPAFAATIAGAQAYEAARSAISGGASAVAEDALGEAIGWDPGLALYWRVRGTLELTTGRLDEAQSDLSHAVAINPQDDLGWRTLALAQVKAGQPDRAAQSIETALAVQRSDQTNVLVAAWLAGRSGDSKGAESLLVEAVQAWPTLTGSAGWTNLLPPGVSSAGVIAKAAARWSSGQPSLDPPQGQGLWLALFNGASSPLQAASQDTSAEEGVAFLDTLRCNAGAGQLVAGLGEADQRTATYWLLRTKLALEAHADYDTPLRLYSLLPTSSLARSAAATTQNPLDENGWQGFSADGWGYGRRTVGWPTYEVSFPSSAGGLARWVWDTAGAARAGGISSRVPGC